MGSVSCEFVGFGAMDATKPYEFIGFGAMDATKPYEFIGFGAMSATGVRKSAGPRDEIVGFGGVRPSLAPRHL